MVDEDKFTNHSFLNSKIGETRGEKDEGSRLIQIDEGEDRGLKENFTLLYFAKG